MILLEIFLSVEIGLNSLVSIFACFSMAGAHEGHIPMFRFDLDLNHKCILNPIVHKTWGNNHMKMRPLGQEWNKQYNLLTT